jgi:hypothetical protein
MLFPLDVCSGAGLGFVMRGKRVREEQEDEDDHEKDAPEHTENVEPLPTLGYAKGY